MNSLRVIPGAVGQDSIRALVLAAGQATPAVVVRQASGGGQIAATVTPLPVSAEMGQELSGVVLFAASASGLQPATEYELEVSSPAVAVRSRFQTLSPDAPGQTLKLVVASCYYDFFHRDADYLAALQSVWCKDAAFKLLVGDNLYLDVAPDQRHITGGYRETVALYLRYFWQSGYADVLGRLPTFTTWDDHEFWNNYPEHQCHLSRTSGSDRKDYIRAGTECLRLFQAVLNADLPPDDNLSYRIDNTPVVSFFAADGRSARTRFENSPPRMMPDAALSNFEAWASSLTRPGVLVIGQPLWIKEGGRTDYTPPNFADQYERIWRAIAGAPHDILVVSGDVHHSRILEIGLTDTRSWRDLDGNGSPLTTGGQVQLNELTASTSTPSFGKNIPSSTTVDPAVLAGWGVRGYNWEYAVSVQHEPAPRVSVNVGFGRRRFGNQTLTVDNRYSLANNSYDGPFCANAPVNANLPDGGGYQVCGLYDLKPSVVALGLPVNNTLTLSSNYGGETNINQGFDFTAQARFSRAFVQGGMTISKRIFDQCNLVDAGILAYVVTAATEVAEQFPDGKKACHQDLDYRPDFKLLGSYTLPLDIQLSGTYQFVRGVQTGGAAPSILATWTAMPASATTLGRAYSAGATTKSANLMPVGYDYGPNNLQQFDLKIAKSFRVDRYRFRVDLDAYNLFNSDWPFTVTSTFSTAATSAWLRPTNVLQARFVKLGMQFEF